MPRFSRRRRRSADGPLVTLTFLDAGGSVPLAQQLQSALDACGCGCSVDDLVDTDAFLDALRDSDVVRPPGSGSPPGRS